MTWQSGVARAGGERRGAGGTLHAPASHAPLVYVFHNHVSTKNTLASCRLRLTRLVGASAGSRGGLGGQRGRRRSPRPPPRPRAPRAPYTTPGIYESIRKASLTREPAEITLNAGNFRLAGSRVVRLIVLTSDIKHGSGY